MSSFEAEVQQVERGTFVRVIGTIDEDNELAPLAARIRGDTALISLAGITEINNCGVRDWVRWLDEVQGKGSVVVLLECSPAIVAQLNQVSNFAGKAFVKSFYVPYFCQQCDAEKSILVDIAELDTPAPDSVPSAPTCRCDTCDAVMAFDDLEESYFAFVKSVRRDIPDSLLDAIEEIAPSGGERKIVTRGAMSSTFTGILSTVGTGAGSFGGSTSVPSAGALRRLRDKTGMRSTRRAEPTDEHGRAPSRRTGLMWLGAIGAAAIIAAAVIVVMMR